MEDLVKAAEAALDIVEKYNLKDENIQNKTIELKVSLDKVKEFQQKVGRLQRILSSIDGTGIAKQTKQP